MAGSNAEQRSRYGLSSFSSIEFCTTSYFTSPYLAQDKGTIENRIGVLKIFFPKKTDFTIISSFEIKKVKKKLNFRPE